MSRNSTSEHRCEQCGYEYNVHKSELAIWIKSTEFIQTTTISIMLLAVVLMGLPGYTLGVHSFFFHYAEWSPASSCLNSGHLHWLGKFLGESLCPWVLHFNVLFEFLCAGVILTSFISYLLELLHERDFQQLGWYGVQICFVFGGRFLRILLVASIAYGYRKLHYQTTLLVNEYVQKWGESILEYNEAEDDNSSRNDVL